MSNRYSFNLVLKVDAFTASDKEEALKMLNDFIDRLGAIESKPIFWSDTDWQTIENGELIQDFSQPLATN